MGASVCLDHAARGVSSCRCCEAWHATGDAALRLARLEELVLRWTEASDYSMDSATERLLAAGRDIRARRAGRAR